MNNFEIFTLIKEYFKEILSVLGGIGMFFLGKKQRANTIKQQSVNITSSELENVEAALKIYRTMLEDLQIKLTEAQDAYNLLAGRFHEALQKNKDYESQVKKLSIENTYLNDRLKDCKK